MTPLQALLQALVIRLRKEVARGDFGTAAVGGIAKVGAATEALVELATRQSCAARGLSLDTEIARGRLSKGLGTYLRLLKEQGRPGGQDADRKIGDMLMRDLRRRHSNLWALSRLRNDTVHPRRDDAVSAGLPVLRESLAWLESEIGTGQLL